MKKILISLLIMTPLFLLAQEDTVQYRIGFMVEFQNFTLKQFGVKYRLNNESKIVVSLFSYYDRFDTPNPYQSNTKNFSIGGSLTYEHHMLEVESVIFFLEGGIGAKYSWEKINSKERKDVNGLILEPAGTFTTHSRDFIGIVGTGAEYFLSKQLSLFTHQDIELNYGNGNGEKDFRIDFGVTKIGLTLFF